MNVLSSGKVQMHMTSNGMTRDITAEQVEKLRNDITEIEHILREKGISSDDS